MDEGPLFEMPWISFPVPTWPFRIIYKSRFRESGASDLHRQQADTRCTDTRAGKALIYTKLNILKVREILMYRICWYMLIVPAI